MKRVLIGICAACSIGVGVSADTRPAVTITGCVVQGTSGDTYILTNVKEDAGDSGVLYWLTSTKGLKERVGRRIEVTGTVSTPGDTGKVKVETDPANSPDTKIEVKAGLKTAEAKIESAVGTTGVKEKTEIQKSVRELHVQSIRTIVSSCQ